METTSSRDLMIRLQVYADEILWNMRQRAEVEILHKEMAIQNIKGPVRARTRQGLT